MNNVVLSARYPQFSEALSQLGYHVINSESVPGLIPYEQDHADMQCLILDDTAFVLKECKDLAYQLQPYYRVIPTETDIAGKYPENVRLNAAVIGKRIIANRRYLDEKVKKYAEERGYQLIHVNQGYAKCSVAIVSDNALITADNGIYHSLAEYKFDILKIRQGRVRLSGAEYGFIGGASGLNYASNKRTLYFAGKIEDHPDYAGIKEFCDKHGTQIHTITELPLTDIGGIIFC